MQIGVIGPYGDLGCEEDLKKIAERIGELLAERKVTVICGGDDKEGIIDAVAKGVKRKNGLVVGFITGIDKTKASRYNDIIIPSGMFYGGREYLLTLACDSIILINGGSGTLNEITVAYQNDIPMVSLKDSGSWASRLSNRYLDKRKRILIMGAKTPEEAVNLSIRLAKDKK